LGRQNGGKDGGGMVKFVSYDGKYPNLCSGKLVLSVDGVIFNFPDYCLSSGGGINPNYEGAYDGEWSIIDWPEGFPENAKNEATTVVNGNIQHGCCGGCI